MGSVRHLHAIYGIALRQSTVGLERLLVCLLRGLEALGLMVEGPEDNKALRYLGHVRRILYRPGTVDLQGIPVSLFQVLRNRSVGMIRGCERTLRHRQMSARKWLFLPAFLSCKQSGRTGRDRKTHQGGHVTDILAVSMGFVHHLHLPPVRGASPAIKWKRDTLLQNR